MFVLFHDPLVILLEGGSGLDLFFAMALDAKASPGISLVVSAACLVLVSVGSRFSHIKGAILRGTQSSVSDIIQEIGKLSQLGITKL
jgi:hypothetical protein